MNEWPRTLQWNRKRVKNKVSQSRKEASWVWAAAGFSLLQNTFHLLFPRSVLKVWCLDQLHQHHLVTWSRYKWPQMSWTRNVAGVAHQSVASGRRLPTEQGVNTDLLFPSREPKVTQSVVSGQVLKFQPQGASPALGVNLSTSAPASPEWRIIWWHWLPHRSHSHCSSSAVVWTYSRMCREAGPALCPDASHDSQTLEVHLTPQYMSVTIGH